MDDQSHVGFVDTHAKGVGRGDHAQATGNESFLRFFLGFRRQPGVVGGGGQPLVGEKAGQFLGLFARGTVSDSAARNFWRQFVGDQAGYLVKLFSRRRLNDIEFEIFALGPAIKRAHLDRQFFPKMTDDVGDHFRLGGCGQALDQRQFARRAVFRRFANVTRDITVIGPKILAPFRQAVGLIEYPGANFALGQHLAHTAIA